MKIILVNRYFHPDISATSQLLTDLASHWAGAGREVHVVTGRQRYEDASAQLPAEETHRGTHIHRIWTTRFGRSGTIGRGIDYATFHLSAAACLMRWARAGDVIVAKTDPPLISVVAGWVARKRGAILVNWLQDLFPEVAQRLGVGALDGIVGRLLGRFRDGSLRAARANVVVGERMSEHVDRIVEGTAAATRIIENWADGSRVRPVAREANALRGEWGLGDRLVVGYSGNMGRAHEFETILQGCERLRAERDVVFLFIGEGRQRAWIEAEAARRSLTNVLFRPYQPVESLAQSLSAPDVHLVTLRPELEGLIVPSKYYGIAAAGRPTIFIGDRDGEIARAVRRDGSGVAVESGDAEGLSRAILALRDDPATRAQMGKCAREVFERTQDLPIAMGRWDALLTDILRNERYTVDS